MDRGKGGLKRSVDVDANSIPLGTVIAPANRYDSPLLGDTLDSLKGALGSLPEPAGMHLVRGYHSNTTRRRLRKSGLLHEISREGEPAPFRVTRRWVVERLRFTYGAR